MHGAVAVAIVAICAIRHLAAKSEVLAEKSTRCFRDTLNSKHASGLWTVMEVSTEITLAPIRV